jgi:hypothetical protein
MDATEARTLLREFAQKHKIVFNEEGECGFGRPCVGLSHGNSWIDYNPYYYEETGELNPPLADLDELNDPRFHAPDGVEAYHKHSCLAVLGRGDAAVVQLAVWIKAITDAGEVEVVQYNNGKKGVQAMLSGPISPAIAFKDRPKPEKSRVLGVV